MTDHPLYLSPALIPAFVAGRVSLLIEPLKVQPGRIVADAVDVEGVWCWRRGDDGSLDGRINLPHAPGDRLWLREAWNLFQFSQDGDEAWPEPEIPSLQEMRDAEELGHRYGAPQVVWKESDRARKWFVDQPWRSPITMPKWASRAWAEIEAVEVKRVQDVTGGGVKAAGVEYDETCLIRDGHMLASYNAFRRHFNATHGPDAWDRNPWCTFTRIKVHAGSLEGEG